MSHDSQTPNVFTLFEKAKATCTWQYVVAEPKTSGRNRRPCPSLQSFFGCNHDLNRRQPHVICGT